MLLSICLTLLHLGFELSLLVGLLSLLHTLSSPFFSLIWCVAYAGGYYLLSRESSGSGTTSISPSLRMVGSAIWRVNQQLYQKDLVLANTRHSLQYVQKREKLVTGLGVEIATSLASSFFGVPSDLELESLIPLRSKETTDRNGSMASLETIDLDVDYDLEEVDQVIPNTNQLETKPSREELKRRLRKARSERKSARTGGSRQQMMQEAGDAMAHMDPEVLQATLQGISSQMGIPVSQISKMMGGLIPQTPTPDTEDNSKDSD